MANTRSMCFQSPLPCWITTATSRKLKDISGTDRSYLTQACVDVVGSVEVQAFPFPDQGPSFHETLSAVWSWESPYPDLSLILNTNCPPWRLSPSTISLNVALSRLWRAVDFSGAPIKVTQCMHIAQARSLDGGAGPMTLFSPLMNRFACTALWVVPFAYNASDHIYKNKPPTHLMILGGFIEWYNN